MRKNRDSIEHFFDYDLHLETRTIYMGSVFTSEDGESGVDSEMAQRVIKSLHILAAINKEPIRIIMNNPGGCVTNGMAIYDAIRACPCETIIEVHGQAMSMGAIILQAATKRLLHPNACIMVHDGSMGMSEVHQKIFEAWGRFLKKSRKVCYRILAERSGKSESYWEKKCLIDYIMTAQKAVQEGLADGIMGVYDDDTEKDR